MGLVGRVDCVRDGLRSSRWSSGYRASRIRASRISCCVLLPWNRIILVCCIGMVMGRMFLACIQSSNVHVHGGFATRRSSGSSWLMLKSRWITVPCMFAWFWPNSFWNDPISSRPQSLTIIYSLIFLFPYQKIYLNKANDTFMVDSSSFVHLRTVKY